MKNHILFNDFVSTKSSFGVRPAPCTRVGPNNLWELKLPYLQCIEENPEAHGKTKT